MYLPQVIKSFQNYRGVATTFYPTLVLVTLSTVINTELDSMVICTSVSDLKNSVFIFLR
jgi:hypothetical protein